MTGTMFFFGTSARVFFNSGSSISFVSSAFAFHADRELAPLKNKLEVIKPLREQILCNIIFKVCKVLG